MLAAIAISLTILGLQPAAFASATSSPSARGTAHTAYPWKGQSPPCAVRLPTYGAISYRSFTTCPPKHVLLIGDSVALSMGIEMSLNEENWGTLIQNASVKDCGFITQDSVQEQGNTTPTNPQCASSLTTWTKDARRFKPQAIVVEMGWWDSYGHLIDGKLASLNEPLYDSLVEFQIGSVIKQLRAVSKAPIYLLSVPLMSPPPLPNGQQEPAASTASNTEINTLLQAASNTSTTVHFLNISPYITPSGQYEADVSGGQCRASDGVGLYYSKPGALQYVQTQCGKALQKGVLGTIRNALQVAPHRHS
jgi:hypothetical protein